MEKIILYSTNCPQCQVLKSKLDTSGVMYETITDVDLMLAKGFQSAPVLEINGKNYNFSEAIKWIKERK